MAPKCWLPATPAQEERTPTLRAFCIEIYGSAGAQLLFHLWASLKSSSSLYRTQPWAAWVRHEKHPTQGWDTSCQIPTGAYKPPPVVHSCAARWPHLMEPISSRQQCLHRRAPTGCWGRWASWHIGGSQQTSVGWTHQEQSNPELPVYIPVDTVIP